MLYVIILFGDVPSLSIAETDNTYRSFCTLCSLMLSVYTSSSNSGPLSFISSIFNSTVDVAYCQDESEG